MENVYTDEQYELLQKIEPGIMWDTLTEQEIEILRYLDSQHLLQPRADIEDGLWFLSQEGKRVLAIRQNMRNEHAEQKTEKIKDRRFQLLNMLAGSAITLIIEHHLAIFSAIKAFFVSIFS